MPSRAAPSPSAKFAPSFAPAAQTGEVGPQFLVVIFLTNETNTPTTAFLTAFSAI
jgi:hypothetical protein